MARPLAERYLSIIFGFAAGALISIATEELIPISRDEIWDAEVKERDGEDCYHIPDSQLHDFDAEDFKKLSWTPTSKIA